MAVPLFNIRKRKLFCNLLGEQVQVGDLLVPSPFSVPESPST